MHTTSETILRRLYAAFRDRHVQVLRGFIILVCFAELGFVLFGRNVAAILLAIAIGSAWLLKYKIHLRF